LEYNCGIKAFIIHIVILEAEQEPLKPHIAFAVVSSKVKPLPYKKNGIVTITAGGRVALTDGALEAAGLKVGDPVQVTPVQPGVICIRLVAPAVSEVPGVPA